MTHSLEYYLNSIPDHRRKQGTMYNKNSLITMMILANMSGCYGYREMAKYMENNVRDFVSIFNLKHGVPKHVSLRNFVMRLDFNLLSACFRRWCNQYVRFEEQEVYSIDGKVMNSTVEHCHNSRQRYKSMISLFCSKTGLVSDTEMIEMKKSHEIEAARKMISRLQAKGIIITADALHCQKKQ